MEQIISKLRENQLNFIRLKTLLEMSETFRALHRELHVLGNCHIQKGDEAEGLSQNEARARVINEILASYGLSGEDLEKSVELCKERNCAAHPTTVPDLTYSSSEHIRLFVAAKQLLNDINAEKENGNPRSA